MTDPAPSPNPLPTTEGATQTSGPGWTLGLCIGECRDQANDQAFQEAGFADFMRATADHLERLRAIDKAEGATRGWPVFLISALVSKDAGRGAITYGHRAVLVRDKPTAEAAKAGAVDEFMKDGYRLESLDLKEVAPLPPPPGQ